MERRGFVASLVGFLGLARPGQGASAPLTFRGHPITWDHETPPTRCLVQVSSLRCTDVNPDDEDPTSSREAFARRLARFNP